MSNDEEYFFVEKEIYFYIKNLDFNIFLDFFIKNRYNHVNYKKIFKRLSLLYIKFYTLFDIKFQKKIKTHSVLKVVFCVLYTLGFKSFVEMC